MDVPTAPRDFSLFFVRTIRCRLSSYRCDRKSQRNVSGVDRRETGLFVLEKNDVTVWDCGHFDPSRRAHLPGNDLKTDCSSTLLSDLFLWQSFHSQTSVLFQRSVFPPPFDAALHQQALFLIWIPPRVTTCAGRHRPVCWSELATTQVAAVRRTPQRAAAVGTCS